MKDLENFIKELGFVKTNSDNYDRLLKVYEKDVFLDVPYTPGGRFGHIIIKLREDREAIRIIAHECCFTDDNILYEGFCKTTDYLRLILQNLFGGDGHDQEWINKQFNDRLFKENIEQ